MRPIPALCAKHRFQQGLLGGPVAQPDAQQSTVKLVTRTDTVGITIDCDARARARIKVEHDHIAVLRGFSLGKDGSQLLDLRR